MHPLFPVVAPFVRRKRFVSGAHEAARLSFSDKPRHATQHIVMSRVTHRSFGVVARLPGLLLAVVALTVQLAAASVVPWAAAPGAGLDRLIAGSICHGDDAAADQGGAPVRHHAPDCTICPLCQAIAHASVLLGPAAIALVGPTRAASLLAALPPARAPPVQRVAAAAPRGPPHLT
jgi:hypothetical protein